MAIKVSSRKCFSATHKRSWQKLAKHVEGHYPKDTELHKAVRGAFKAMDDAASKIVKGTKKSPKPKRSMAKRRTMKRRTAPKRRTVKRAKGKKRSTPKRRTARRAAPRRTTKRRMVRRRAG
jgi:hypothetical protein